MSGINGINGGVAGGGAPKPSVSSKEKQDEVLAVLRTKEEEVKEMLAPEKEMRGGQLGKRVCVLSYFN